MAPDFLTDSEHEHNDEVTSVSFEVEKPIDPEKFNAWIGALQTSRDLIRFVPRGYCHTRTTTGGSPSRRCI